MTPETRRKALEQTARIAFGVTAFSCGGSQPKEAHVEPLPTVSASATAQPPRPLRPPPSAVCAEASDKQTAVRCCIDATLEAARQPDGNWATTRPDLRSCCQTIDQAVGLMSALYGKDQQWSEAACYACLQALGQRPSACTPWGPPMPPAMA